MMIVMRYAKGHKEQVRGQIIRAAAAKLRSEGLDGPSVPELMKEAGLTHGGFYGYFHGREELVAEAVLAAGQQTADGLFRARSDLASVIDAYLSEKHLRHPEAGCVVAALGSDGWRQDAQIRNAFADVAVGLARLVTEKVEKSDNPETMSDRALAVTAQMVGALVLARLARDRKLQQRILRASRAAALNI